ncbi:LysM peptidoglycan-binding domain-containing protein [Demequina flava]|uniref:LysM peptidoglycan-binding domain-containing protein n=1 Tax=Demequina flava TaxID=1095025 RepID=UPI001F3E945A|nr:LysM domain-containing protein [Demequina flava]
MSVPALTTALAWAALHLWHAISTEQPTLSDVVLLAACATGVAVGSSLTWSAVSMALRAGSARARGLGSRWAPPLWRRIVATALGAAVAGTAAAPAMATTEADPASAGWLSTPVASTQVETGPQTDAGADSRRESPHTIPASTSGAPDTAPTESPAPTTDETVTVETGDTLWDITAQALPQDATPAQIAQSWPDLHAANKDAVGKNPDLIHAGTELTIPKEWQS